MNISHRRALQRTALIVAALTAAGALSGCAFDFLPKQDGTSASEAPTPTPTPTEEPSGTDGAESTESEPSETESAGGSEGRDAFEDRIDRTISCPGGVLDIADISSVIALDSDCTDITISGSGTVLLGKNIENLEVVGTNNQVFVGELSTLDVSGHGNEVAWESGSPTVSNVGINNLLNPAS